MNIQEAIDYGHFCDIENLDPNLDSYYNNRTAKYRATNMSTDRPGDIVTQEKNGQITVVIIQRSDNTASRTVSFCICLLVVYVLHELLFIALFLK
jgi:hypothetical protein